MDQVKTKARTKRDWPLKMWLAVSIVGGIVLMPSSLKFGQETWIIDVVLVCWLVGLVPCLWWSRWW